MGNNFSTQPDTNRERSSSLLSRVSLKKWSKLHAPSDTPGASGGNSVRKRYSSQYSKFSFNKKHVRNNSLSDRSSFEISCPLENNNDTMNESIEFQESINLVGQLEALLENPNRFSSHHRAIALLTHQVSTVLDGSSLINQLRELIQEPQKFSRYDKEITMLTRRASTIFENQIQTYHRIAYSSLPLVIGRIAQDCGIFEALVASKDEAFDVASLAEMTGLQQSILEVFLEYMAAQHMIDDVGDFLYRANNVTFNLLKPIAIYGLPVFNDLFLPIINHLGVSVNDRHGRSAHNLAFNTSLDLTSWLEKNPKFERELDKLNRHQWDLVPSWHSVVDFQEEFTGDSDDRSFVFVDVGGGMGDQCIVLLDRFPGLRGQVVLQDKPEILHKSHVPDRILKVPCNFFRDQPIQGAYVYYFRRVLSKNIDEAVIQILKAQVPAMGKESFLLIDDKVLPDMKLTVTTSMLNLLELNILMLACFNVFERRQSQWLRLLDEAGYEVAQIHPYSDLHDCIIVAKVKFRPVMQRLDMVDQRDI
ncbi:BgtA-20455 [Blumeria graminis f. sp. tritici]|uniref:BgtA-20455 n=2 Tax=Blumeria graminis f. sp. tritici TaxID=62690 RepID=A0A9X9PR86_BLUGR|nr:hypothetical protein BGT96224_A20455 [Blumeria graminis f. sp. tritici 96224]VCU39564.1 BgtA-20455 [Blumeria graminis f. sp. tritici]